MPASTSHRFRSAGFVGGPHRPAFRVVGDPVRVVTGGGLPEHGGGVFVEDDQPVVAGGGDIDPAQLGNDEDAMRLGQVRDRPHHLPGGGGDLDDLAGTVVGRNRDSRVFPVRRAWAGGTVSWSWST